MAENTLNRFKRKMRGSSSSDNESLSPQEKKQNRCKSAEDTASDVTKVMLKLDEVLSKLDEMDRKVEGVLENIKGLENTIKSVQSDVVTLNDRVALMESSVNEMDNGMKFINSEENELKGKTDNNLQEIKALTQRISCTKRFTIEEKTCAFLESPKATRMKMRTHM